LLLLLYNINSSSYNNNNNNYYYYYYYYYTEAQFPALASSFASPTGPNPWQEADAVIIINSAYGRGPFLRCYLSIVI